MPEEKNTQKSFALRSEKVRHIVGQMPPVLLRYGTATIALTLLVMLAIAYYLPMKRTFQGEAAVLRVEMERNDSVTLQCLFRFGNQRPSAKEAVGAKVILHTNQESIEGVILSIDERLDTEGRQEVLCKLPTGNADMPVGQTVDFVLTYSSPGFLKQLVATVWPG